MDGIKTQNNRYLVKAGDGKVVYTDLEGNFLRSADDPENEWEWAQTTWKDPKIETMTDEFKKNLEGQLKYVVL